MMYTRGFVVRLALLLRVGFGAALLGAAWHCSAAGQLQIAINHTAASVSLHRTPDCPIVQGQYTCRATDQDASFSEAALGSALYASANAQTARLQALAKAEVPAGTNFAFGVWASYTHEASYLVRNTGTTAIDLRVSMNVHAVVDGSNINGQAPPTPGRRYAQSSVDSKTTLLAYVNDFFNPGAGVTDATLSAGYWLVDGQWHSTSSSNVGGADRMSVEIPVLADTEWRMSLTSDVITLRPGFRMSLFASSQGTAITTGGIGSSVVNDSMNTLALGLNVLTPGTTVTAPFSLPWVSVVPEPEQWALFMTGLGLLALAARRRHRPASSAAGV